MSNNDGIALGARRALSRIMCQEYPRDFAAFRTAHPNVDLHHHTSKVYNAVPPGNDTVMTHGPPSTAAGSSKSPASSSSNAAHTTSQIQQPDPAFAAWNANQLPPHYPTHPPIYRPAPTQNYAVHAAPVPMSYYPNISANPYASYMAQPQSYSWTPTSSRVPPSTPYATLPKPNITQIAPKTPPPPEPETYKHWDEVVKKFLVRAKFMQTLKGFENDMLVLNASWEQEVIPEALSEMVKGLQVSFLSFVANYAVILTLDYRRLYSTGLRRSKRRTILPWIQVQMSTSSPRVLRQTRNLPWTNGSSRISRTRLE